MNTIWTILGWDFEKKEVVGLEIWRHCNWEERWGPTVSHDLRLSSSHDKLLHCVISQPWENIEFVLKLVVGPTGEIVSWSYIAYELGHYWWKSVAIGILNKGTMISHGIETVCLLGWSQGSVFMETMLIVVL